MDEPVFEEGWMVAVVLLLVGWSRFVVVVATIVVIAVAEVAVAVVVVDRSTSWEHHRTAGIVGSCTADRAAESTCSNKVLVVGKVVVVEIPVGRGRSVVVVVVVVVVVGTVVFVVVAAAAPTTFVGLRGVCGRAKKQT